MAQRVYLFFPDMKIAKRIYGSMVGVALALVAGIPVARSAAPADPPAPSPAATGWTLTALGTLGGDSSRANAINDAGQVVGAADTSLKNPANAGGRMIRDPFFAHAFLYADGKMQDLGALNGNESEARAINSSGQIVGQVGGYFGHAFLYSDGQMSNFDFPDGGSSQPMAINASGQIVGMSSVKPQFAGYNKVILFRDGKMQDLNLSNFFGKDSGLVSIVGMNDAGLILGEILNFGFGSGKEMGRAFIYHPEGWVEFIGFYPSAINAAGQVVGQGNLTASNGSMHAFLYSDGKEQDLGALGEVFSSARAINASGQVVGIFGASVTHKEPAQGHAFVYRDGKMQDLNTLVGEAGLAAAGFKVLYTATGINARGQIVGTGTDLKGHDMAFLLTPPPERKGATDNKAGQP